MQTFKNGKLLHIWMAIANLSKPMGDLKPLSVISNQQRNSYINLCMDGIIEIAIKKLKLNLL